MNARWVVIRCLGLLAVLLLAVWVGERLAGAEEKAPPQQKTVTPAPPPKLEAQRNPRPADYVSATPPRFPFGPQGGSANPANPGSTQTPGFQLHP